MNKSARLVAFEVLYKIFYDNSYSNIALDAALREAESDKPFISSLVYGVTERRLTLDYFINKHLTSKPKPKIMTILRLGAYQLLYMDKVHAAAAINESVELAKLIKQDYYAPLVNAVLHSVDSDREMPDDLSVKYSVPEPLINMWRKQYGEDALIQILDSVNGRPPVFAVPNTLYCDADELSYELLCDSVECEVAGELVRINSAFDINKLRAYNNGLFHIEDMSSYECAEALGAKQGDTVLDMCSAPGGKAFTVAEFMNNEGRVYCYDLHENRVDLIRNGAERLGLSCITAGVNDALIFNPDIPCADKVLCDVPCSGFGILRRKPEIRYKELDSIAGLPEIQLGIISTSSCYVKPGGTLLYSTCTLNKKENEKVVAAFLDGNSNFRLDREKTVFPSADGGDGFYYAVIIRNEK